MQTGTKKTPDRFQNYFCPAAANDIVHHAYAWIVKEPNMQPKFLYCRAIDDPANVRGWNIIAEVWERDVLGGWGISSSTIHPEFEDTADGYVLAEGMPGTAASLPYQVFREVVNEHDTNYLIALAIAIDALPKDSTCDMASETIRANADIDIAERRKSVLPDQAGLAAKKASCIESLAHIGGNAPVCGQNEIARQRRTDMSEIKTKIRTYNDVIDLFGEEKAADMLSEALDWSTIDPKNDKKNILERKPLLLDPYMTYEGEDYCKHIVAGFLGDRDLDWASGYIDEEKIKNGQVMPADLKSALSMALDNELSTSWAYLDALSSQCAEIFNKFAGYIESAGLASGVLVPGEYELDSNALNADVSERFNIQYGFQCDQMIDAMQFDMTLILTEKVDSMDGYRLIQSVCDWREENLEVIEDAENNLDYGKVPSYVAYERPADIGTTIIDELCASQGTAVEKLVNYPTTKFERTMRDELFEALAVNETTISLMAKVPSSVFLDAVACMDSRYMSGHTVDTGHAFIVSPGTYEPYIGIHDPVYGAGYMMVDLDKPFEIPMNRIWIAMDDYSGPETKEGLRGMYHSPQDVSAFSDPFCGSVSVTPTRDEKQEPAKSGLEAKRDACAISAAHLDSPNTEIPDGKNMERE